MKKPLIGIVSKNITCDDFFNWQWQRISEHIRYSLIKNGASVIGILPQCNSSDFNRKDESELKNMSASEKSMLNDIINNCDGIILQGGISSHYYEEYIAKYCYEKNIPLLGICAGFNNIIRALGGTTKKLDNDDHDRPDLQYSHDCIITDKNSLYYSIVKSDKFMVNSVHSYIADIVPSVLSIIAKSDDNQVEVIESKNKTFFMGVKYHPELLVDIDEKQNNIFKTFVKKCKSKGGK